MTNDNLIPFTFEGKDVRVVTQSNEPWWVLSDVCDVLEHSNSRKAGERLDADEKADVNISYTSSNGVTQRRNVTTINESGLWSLVLTSRKAEAKRFKKWLTSEVIPSIRKHGGYMVASQKDTPETLMARALQLADRTIKERDAQLEVANPKALAFDELANTEGTFTLRDSAKLCGWPEKRFIQKLVQDPIKWLYVQTSTGRKHAYAKPIKEGYMDVKQVTIFHKTTGRETYGQPVLTQKGLTKIATTLGAFTPVKEMAHA
ncbi:phage antirepressor KilAC domain-containing protein [Saccharibacter floricola]|uniref:Prophage antirepressor n=1 Tax=Saccharibacter floricola DSM 15669 TaxID=1123227 RepID=A0ABQ0NZC4_9PROT|nr:phage antirepressor KilAC domain-containing protein [Saccharibacter floricola]GBQ07258.1 prophage antirepressor [Saccharibacter floricola DSM 15669]